MVKQNLIFILLIFFFLLFSFSPTIFELSQSNKLADPAREFILEHNYYWPDFNLYLSKIRQGTEGHLTAVEKYTGEIHQGSLIQEFYVILGLLGGILDLDPNFSYQLGRLILSPLLLLVILMLVKYYFPANYIPIPEDTNPKSEILNSKQYQNSNDKNSKRFGFGKLENLNLFRISDFVFRISSWQLLAFLVTITSGSFPRFYTDANGALQIGRYMEWWSNIDALQRITFIPHILFGQVVSFFLLHQLTIRHSGLSRISNARNDSGVADAPQNDRSVISIKKFFILIFLGNAVGIVFPPSLITLDGVLILILFIKLYHKHQITNTKLQTSTKLQIPSSKQNSFRFNKFGFIWNLEFGIWNLLFILFTLPSLLYLYLITKQLPWSALVEFHRTHPMMIPLDQYVLGTGPVIIFGFFGMLVSVIKKEKKFLPLILWVVVTFSFASLFSAVKEQSPLRFTQTGLFIPLGLLTAYLFYQLLQIRPIRLISLIGITFFLLSNLFIMRTSLNWQNAWIKQLVGANIPPVPYPPQAIFPLKSWMDGIRWLRDNTNHDDVVLAEITAGNYIPAYAGNFVYFGQSNTVDYNRKQLEVDKFFSGKMQKDEAKQFLQKGRIKYIFFGVQEKEKSGGKDIELLYPYFKLVYSNSIVAIYSY